MNNSQVSERLNEILVNIGKVVNSLNFIDSSEISKDAALRQIAGDAINYRLAKISRLLEELKRTQARGSQIILDIPEIQLVEILVELDNRKASTKTIRELVEIPLESLRKVALSEILRISLE